MREERKRERSGRKKKECEGGNRERKRGKGKTMIIGGNNRDTMKKKTEKGRERGELWVGT